MRNKNAVPWKNGTIPARELSRVLYELMGWQKEWKYIITADCFEKNGVQVIFYNLNCCEYRFKHDGNGVRPMRVIPKEWLSNFGEYIPEYMMVCRRALADYLSDWKINAPSAAVTGFDTGFTLLSRSETELKISEMRGEDV